MLGQRRSLDALRFASANDLKHRRERPIMLSSAQQLRRDVAAVAAFEMPKFQELSQSTQR